MFTHFLPSHRFEERRDVTLILPPEAEDDAEDEVTASRCVDVSVCDVGVAEEAGGVVAPETELHRVERKLCV